MPEIEKTKVSKYTKGIVIKLRAMTRQNGKRLFAKVGRMADLDLQRILKIPAFPAAIVSRMDDEIETPNGEIWNNTISISIIIKSNSDVFQDEALEVLDEIEEAVVNEFVGNRDNGGIRCIFISGESVVTNEGEDDRMMKTLVFAYSIDRQTS